MKPAWTESPETPEFLTYFPEYKPDYDRVHADFERLVANVEGAYAACKDIVIQRDFALALQAKTACTAPCFQLRAGKIKTIREWFLTCNVEMLARLLAPAGNGV